jgi:hypothetical protein
MSIQSEINRIISARDSSFTAVAAKGVTVPSGSTIDDLPGLIALIATGGGVTVTETQDTAGGTIVTIVSDVTYISATGVEF